MKKGRKEGSEFVPFSGLDIVDTEFWSEMLIKGILLMILPYAW